MKEVACSGEFRGRLRRLLYSTKKEHGETKSREELQGLAVIRTETDE